MISVFDLALLHDQRTDHYIGSRCNSAHTNMRKLSEKTVNKIVVVPLPILLGSLGKQNCECKLAQTKSKLLSFLEG